jgi:glutaconate CoA-transferase subunit B
MAVTFARDLLDGERGAAGMNSLVPWAAILLARALHAPNLVTCGEPSVNVSPSKLFVSPTDPRSHEGAEATETFLDIFGYSHHGLDFWFHSGLQIDAYGNVNLHCIGDIDKPRVRGPGVPNVSYAVTSKRFYLYPMNHQVRTFVERVDFISVAGNLRGPDSKRTAKMLNEGPRLCVTPLAVLDFNPDTLRMRLKSIHDGVAIGDVVDRTGFDLEVPRPLPVTPPPSKTELETLRRDVDPDGLLRNGPA